jgi:hypothetical protein
MSVVQSPVGSLAVADYTFSKRASARERVCVCVCATVWGLTLPILVLSASLTWSLACCPPHSPTATITRRRQQIYQLLGSPNMWLHCLHGWHHKLRSITIYLVYTKYIPGIWHWVYLSYDRDMTCYLSYTCHMTSIWLDNVCHVTMYVLRQTYTHFKLSGKFRYLSRYCLDLWYAWYMTVICLVYSWYRHIPLIVLAYSTYNFDIFHS